MEEKSSFIEEKATSPVFEGQVFPNVDLIAIRSRLEELLRNDTSNPMNAIRTLAEELSQPDPMLPPSDISIDIRGLVESDPLSQLIVERVINVLSSYSVSGGRPLLTTEAELRDIIVRYVPLIREELVPLRLEIDTEEKTNAPADGSNTEDLQRRKAVRSAIDKKVRDGISARLNEIIKKREEKREKFIESVVLQIRDADVVRKALDHLSLSETESLSLIKRTMQLYPANQGLEVEWDGMGPTSAYLRVMGNIPKVRELVNDMGNFLEVMMRREEIYGSDHYVFYHAQRGDYRSLRWMIDIISGAVETHAYADDNDDARFTLLREPKSMESSAGKYAADVREKGSEVEYWVEKMKTAEDSDVPAHVLSTNMSLLGNALHKGESTVEFYKNNTSITQFRREILEEQVRHYKPGVSESTLNNLVRLVGKEKTKGASLLQIFIPKGIVERLAYLAGPGGHTYENHTDLVAHLNTYLEDPSSLGPALDYMQARLIMSDRAFRDRAEGIKYFEYHKLTPAQIRRFEARVRSELP
ncbi:MAG: hypothetical protein F6K40_02645 [Okeania sp. SIO3I5]|uniref:hypothetical protein n=1 Tax=Okeania sp. SIO3I5 TaxID=2607805 RepID=UPI0013B74968|nr:hypothetical protein [Okeania sp. SIO3I5]NEQ35261.1 hypothetical protein [Okeania sp. SIO3I5]